MPENNYGNKCLTMDWSVGKMPLWNEETNKKKYKI